MPHLNIKQASILRYVSYSYFLVICIVCLYNTRFHSINWQFLIIIALLALQLKFNIRPVDGFLGLITALCSFYMILAVTSDVVDHFNGTKPLSNPILFMSGGYGIFGLALLAAIAMVYAHFVKENLSGNSSKAGLIEGKKLYAAPEASGRV